MPLRKLCTIEWSGLKFDIKGQFVPAQQAVLTADPYYSTPAVGPDIEPFYIYHNGVDITQKVEDYLYEVLFDEALLRLE